MVGVIGLVRSLSSASNASISFLCSATKCRRKLESARARTDFSASSRARASRWGKKPKLFRHRWVEKPDLLCEDATNTPHFATVECSKPCSSAIHRRRTQLPTPDESGNYNGGTIKDPVGNNDRCSLLKCVTPIRFRFLIFFSNTQSLSSTSGRLN